ncbi:MAG: hypothetical protein OXI34_03500 [Chloroflexota bacterium]|nr:hypothetical protein [Chloroflexota bacterium]MDE2948052.1 hypothetical protein [Chloroflexota bacterium]
MNILDETTVQVYSVLFVMATVLLVFTARFFQKRPGRRRAQRQLDGLERITGWTTQSIESNRPLHLSFGGAAIGGDKTPAALAEAELFHQVIKRANAGDIAPILSMSAPVMIPLGQDTLRRAWHKGDGASRVIWYPPNLAYAGAVTASMADDKPAAHIMAGGFGIELALMLDGADRQGHPSLAVSDRLDGQAVAYALADHVLIGEELFVASGAVSEEGRGRNDAAVLDVWRGLIILGATVFLLLEFSSQLPLLTWQLAAAGAAVLIALGAVMYRRR